MRHFWPKQAIPRRAFHSTNAGKFAKATKCQPRDRLFFCVVGPYAGWQFIGQMKPGKLLFKGGVKGRRHFLWLIQSGHKQVHDTRHLLGSKRQRRATVSTKCSLYPWRRSEQLRLTLGPAPLGIRHTDVSCHWRRTLPSATFAVAIHACLYREINFKSDGTTQAATMHLGPRALCMQVQTKINSGRNPIRPEFPQFRQVA